VGASPYGAGQSRRSAKNAYLNAVAHQQSRSTHAIPHVLQNRRCMRNKRVAMMELATRLLPRMPQAPSSEGLCQACAKTPRHGRFDPGCLGGNAPRRTLDARQGAMSARYGVHAQRCALPWIGSAAAIRPHCDAVWSSRPGWSAGGVDLAKGRRRTWLIWCCKTGLGSFGRTAPQIEQ
jgi:hypothetical protein